MRDEIDSYQHRKKPNLLSVSPENLNHYKKKYKGKHLGSLIMYINKDKTESPRSDDILNYIFCWRNCRNVGVFENDFYPKWLKYRNGIYSIRDD